MNKKLKSQGSRTFRLHESTIADSILDSTSARIPHSLCEDSLQYILLARDANDHIRIIRDVIQSTKDLKMQLRNNIQDLKLQLSNLEHSSQKNILNTEYDMSQKINKLKQSLTLDIINQRDQNCQFSQMLNSLEQDCDDITYQSGKLEQKLTLLCKQTGQYFYE